METITLSQLIGSKVEGIRYSYTPENEYGQQQFNSYIKLSNGFIIDIPIFDEEEFLELSNDNISYFRNQFDAGVEFLDSTKQFLFGQAIEDFYFCYYNEDIVGDERAYIKLTNGFYLTEINFGPPGISIGLLILDQNEFTENVRQLEQQVKSYVEIKKNVC
jgi:hypothetical protein